MRGFHNCRERMNAMKSPCKECTRRKLGCHNVDTCPQWREYVENNQKAKAIRSETAMQGCDWERHLRRHGQKVPGR